MKWLKIIWTTWKTERKRKILLSYCMTNRCIACGYWNEVNGSCRAYIELEKADNKIKALRGRSKDK